MLHRLEPLLEEVDEPLVASVKLREDGGQKRIDLVIAKRHHPADDPRRPLRVCRLERAVEHPCVVWPEQHAGAGHMHQRSTPVVS